MAKNPSINAYPEARRFMDAALDAPNGVATGTMTEAKAKKFRQHCYHLRANVRNASQRTYDPNHPMYAASPWDSITLTLQQMPEGHGWRVVATSGETSITFYDPITGEELTS